MTRWQKVSGEAAPNSFVVNVKSLHPEAGRHTAQLLWQRGWRDLGMIQSFLLPKHYQPTSAFAFREMSWAMARLTQAWQAQETIGIWGDFDADGVTATAVLWEGLGQFFPQQQRLFYYIPNRFRESHGLSAAGLAQFQAKGCQLLITCDTGSTSLAEISIAQGLGMDVIITDHHTLPPYRPNVTAMINPREFTADHPLRDLSGVAVAYKFLEALYETIPNTPRRPLGEFLDLVAIGLIADLVELRGDCRYLAQMGIEQLQTLSRPGVKALLELARKKGDRPTDISFGLGPRINAVSRIHGDASLCVELLTTRDMDQAKTLATTAELANDRRKALQKTMIDQAETEIARLDLTTTHVIILMQPDWSVGLVGVAAGHLAQKYGRPVILLRGSDSELTNGVGEFPGSDMASFGLGAEGSLDSASDSELSDSRLRMAVGSARSVPGLDLYELLQNHSHLLQRFGGHPFAAGLSLPVENVSLLRDALNQAMGQRRSQPLTIAPLAFDLDVTVAELDLPLFRELKLLEPHGLGNPKVILRVVGVEVQKPWANKLKDAQGKAQDYRYVTFTVVDPQTQKKISGLWWEHQPQDIPATPCDLLAELDFNIQTKAPFLRVIDLRPSPHPIVLPSTMGNLEILDFRHHPPTQLPKPVLVLENSPQSWTEWRQWLTQAQKSATPLALLYPPPPRTTPTQAWQRLIGLTRYLSRTQTSIPLSQLQAELGIGEVALSRGLLALTALGVVCELQRDPANSEAAPQFRCTYPQRIQADATAVAEFTGAVAEDQFRRHYFAQVATPTLQQMGQEFGSIETVSA